MKENSGCFLLIVSVLISNICCKCIQIRVWERNHNRPNLKKKGKKSRKRWEKQEKCEKHKEEYSKRGIQHLNGNTGSGKKCE